MKEDLSSCWISLSKRGGIGILMRKQFEISGELALEDSVDLSQDRLGINNLLYFIWSSKQDASKSVI